MLFSPPTVTDNLVIVPPKPVQQDEFSYTNLYSYGNDYYSLSLSTAPGVVMMDTSAERGHDIAMETCSPSHVSDEDIHKLSSLSISKNDSMDEHQTTENSLILQRDPRNGAFTFQVHAEYDLLLHVQKDLDRHAAKDKNDVDATRLLLKSVDAYCLRKQWMYHIGREKGVAVRNFLRRALFDFVTRHSDELTRGKARHFNAVDLGTYCGYSALVMCHAARSTLLELEASGDARAKCVEFAVFTTEISSKLINVAQSMFRLGKMDRYIKPILIEEGQAPSAVLRNNGCSAIDFLLLDHAKDRYLADLTDLERAKMLGAGTYVSADNVVFNRLDSYRDHMAGLARKGVVETRLEEMNLEYSNNLRDGIEMSRYLRDPM